MDVQRLDGVRDEEGMAKFIRDYERYKYPDWDNLTYPEGMKSKRLFVFNIYIFLYFKTSSLRVISSLYRFLYRPQPLTTSRRWEGLTQFILITRSNSGPSSQVCGPDVCYWRHHGAPHRLLPHQRGGDTLLRGQDYAQHDGRKILAIIEMLISSI